MIRGIHHIAMNTADLDRLRAFYVDVIGFEPAVPEHSWADSPMSDAAIGLKGSVARQQMLKAGNCYLELFEYAEPAPRDGEPNRPCDRGYTHFALDVTDIEAEYDRLAAAGMRFAHDRPIDFGEIKAVYGQDPDGNIIEIQQTTREQAFALAKLGTISFA
jgi:catechol 2,3-dioxygenase-like lactoylglutathione lyase family enzyme